MNPNQTPPLKKIPKIITKGWIYANYGYTKSILQADLHQICDDLNFSKTTSFIPLVVYKKFVERYELPRGYEW